MNDYLSTLYDAPHEIDPQLAAAGELLAKIAEEEDVDLDDYSDGEINEMLSGMVGQGEDGEDGEEGGGAAPEEKTSGHLPQHVTTADVAAELAKVASNEGVDLSQLSREQYHDAYNYVHATLTDPAMYQQKVAMEEKVAEADMLGRVMAHSFDDELRKVAGTAADYRAGIDAGMGKVESARMAGTDAVRRGGSKAKEMAGKGYEAVKGQIRKHPGKAGLLAGGALVGTGAAMAARSAKKKRESEKNSSLVLDRAREIAYANGFDPDTGEKVASDIDMAAINLLRENGYDL